MAPDFTSPEVKADRAIQFAVKSLSERDASFERQKLIQIANKQVLGHATIADVEKAYLKAVQKGAIIEGEAILSGLTARIGEFKVPYTIENELSPTTVELINCYSQSVCYLAGVSGSDKCYGMTSGRDIGMMIHGKLFHDLLQYKFAVMNGQGLNTKDKNVWNIFKSEDSFLI